MMYALPRRMVDQTNASGRRPTTAIYTADQVLINPVPNIQALTSHKPRLNSPLYLSRQTDYCVLLLSGRVVLYKSSDFCQSLRCASSSPAGSEVAAAAGFETSWDMYKNQY